MKRIIGFIFILSAIVLFSCQKENTDLANDQTLSEKSAQIVLNEVAIENASTEVDYEVDFYANAEVALTQWCQMGKHWGWASNLRYQMNHCPNLQIDSENGDYPKTITLDYGDSTVLRNGKVLSGVIVIEISGPRSSEDYSRLITYQDFGVDSLLINGTAEVTFTRGEDIFRTFNSDITFTLADGSTINRTSERVWEWLEGMDTNLDQNDDKIQITGYSVAETSSGDVYRKEITEPLIRIRDCKFIVQGVVEITLNGELISSIDYGNGECDNTATVTSNGETVEIDLSLGKFRNKFQS